MTAAIAPSSELQFTNLEELEDLVTDRLPKQVLGYYKSGADAEATVADNRNAFKRMRLLPRMLVDVSRLDTTVCVQGKKLAFPVLIAPMAMQRMAHPEGELAVARAAAACGIPMVQSTMGTVGLRDVYQAGRGAPLMLFQLYVLKDRDFTRDLIQDAERAGYNALVVTVDAPFLGNREADVINDFGLPKELSLENLAPLKRKYDRLAKDTEKGSGIAHVFVKEVDASLTWEFLTWLRTVTSLPIFVKGILAVADAVQAADMGVEGIIVSNHGGRQLDFAPAAIDMLPDIANAVKGRGVTLLVDGGIRRGTDIIKALALGADAVLLGRPILYGLALGGQAGVERVLAILKREFSLSLALMGCPKASSLTPDAVLRSWGYHSKL